MEKIIFDSGVIKVLMRPVRDNLSEIPASLFWWQRARQAEPYKFAEGVASVLREDVGYWYSKVSIAMQSGFVATCFVSGQGGEWGAPTGGVVVITDQLDSGRAELLYLSGTAFAESSKDELLRAAKEWAASKGRKIVQKVVTWVEV